MAAIAEAGARVEYIQADVRDPEIFGAVIDDIYHRYGAIDGVIHGAGIIRDKLIHDLTPESFQQVLGTKAESVFILSRKIRPEKLKFFVLFSSVAGRFGNPGQSAYTAANEVMNKMAVYLNEQWPGRVVAINWGPWKSGMVSLELERQFATRGVRLIAQRQGAAMLGMEITHGRKEEVEVVIGDGPWGQI
jgi:NAD(P)-dependent dehydrogenase (short-subunit alcohol dehydrogenase family)